MESFLGKDLGRGREEPIKKISGTLTCHSVAYIMTDVVSQEMVASMTEKRLIAEGREAEVFDLQNGCVLKLLRGNGKPERVVSEMAALEAARSAGVRVPQVYEQVTVEGRPGIVMERLKGLDLLSAIGGQPWLVCRFGRLTGQVHAQINATRAPASLPSVKNAIQDALARMARREPSMRFEWIEGILAPLPDGDSLCHSDFHPGQIVFADGEATVLDWAGATRGDPLFDYARTRVLLGMGELPPGTPRRMKLLATVGRRLLVACYTRSYERDANKPLDRARLRDWEIVNLAVRLSDNILGERAYLQQRLQTLKARHSRIR
jgi:Phosphotransferase enzyme family